MLSDVEMQMLENLLQQYGTWASIAAILLITVLPRLHSIDRDLSRLDKNFTTGLLDRVYTLALHISQFPNQTFTLVRGEISDHDQRIANAINDGRKEIIKEIESACAEITKSSADKAKEVRKQLTDESEKAARNSSDICSDIKRKVDEAFNEMKTLVEEGQRSLGDTPSEEATKDGL